MRFETPKEDVDKMLEVEASVTTEELPLYLSCMNGIPLSVRVKSPRPLDGEGRDVRDGCLLTGVFLSCSPKAKKLFDEKEAIRIDTIIKNNRKLKRKSKP